MAATFICPLPATALLPTAAPPAVDTAREGELECGCIVEGEGEKGGGITEKDGAAALPPTPTPLAAALAAEESRERKL